MAQLQAKATSAGDFAAAIRAHENYVLRRPGGRRAFLRFAQASGVGLGARRLDEIDLTGAVLNNADLAGSNLTSASLNCADLTNANMAGAILNRADLRGARVKGANFDYAQMQGSDFRHATIARADPQGGWTIVGGHPIRGSVSFENSSLQGARLDDANLRDANFDGALLNNACFKGATLGDASFERAVLIGVHLPELRIAKERLKNCITEPGPELRAQLPRLIGILDDARTRSLPGDPHGCAANLEGEDIRLLAELMKSRPLTRINCARTIAVGADFSGCEFQAANFDGADLRGASFEGVDLRGASFRGANLAHASLSNANLSPLRLANGEAMTTNFDGALLDRCNFDGARRHEELVDPDDVIFV